MFFLCLTGINEPSERNATTEKTSVMKMATESPEKKTFKVCVHHDVCSAALTHIDALF